jgi:lipoate-protein ligase A
MESAVRDSGGGAVVVGPDMQIWLGVYERTADGDSNRPSISASLLSLGAQIQQGLRMIGAPAGEIVTRPTPRCLVSSLVCFAGASYGEILVDGRKIVGISQRRTRELVISHAMVLTEPSQDMLYELFDSKLSGERGLSQVTLRELGVEILTPSDVVSTFATSLESRPL